MSALTDVHEEAAKFDEYITCYVYYGARVYGVFIQVGYLVFTHASTHGIPWTFLPMNCIRYYFITDQMCKR